jgi:histone H2B
MASPKTETPFSRILEMTSKNEPKGTFLPFGRNFILARQRAHDTKHRGESSRATAKRTKRRLARTSKGGWGIGKNQSYSRYIHRVMIHQKMNDTKGITISKKGMTVMNDLITDVFDKIANEASQMMKANGKRTIKVDEIESACKLVLSGGLLESAKKTGKTAFFKFFEA